MLQCIIMGFPSGAVVKNPPAKQETQVWSLGQEDPLEKEMASYSSILAWKIPWTEEPGRLQSMGLQRVRHDWVTHFHFLFSSLSLFNEYIFSWTYPPYILTLVPLFLLSFCFTLPKKKKNTSFPNYWFGFQSCAFSYLALLVIVLLFFFFICSEFCHTLE